MEEIVGAIKRVNDSVAEISAAAAESLRQQAQRLVGSVSVFKLVQLVHASRPVGALNRFDVQQIVVTSRRHNWRAGVSGSLLFAGTGIVQILEGQRGAVRSGTAGQLPRISDGNQLSGRPQKQAGFPFIPSMGRRSLAAAAGGM